MGSEMCIRDRIKVGPSWGNNEKFKVEVPDWIDESFLKELPPSLRP